MHYLARRRKRDNDNIGAVMAMLITLVTSFIFLVVGFIYFIITLLVVKSGANALGYAPDANYAVLSAALIVIGCVLCATLRK